MVGFIEVEKDTTVSASPRVDLEQSFRVGDHVRLRSASPPTNAPLRKPRMLDGLIIRSGIGSLKIQLMEPLPPERCSWYILPAGNNTTASAMIEAIRKMAKRKQECCKLYGMLLGIPQPSPPNNESSEVASPKLNASQSRAVAEAAQKDLTLIWGPPGTGKTTTIVHIIEKWRQLADDDEHILVAASTNNAVDNVLAKYITEADTVTDAIVRFCPDSS